MRRILQLARITCTLTGLLFLVVSFTPLDSWLVQHFTADWYDGDADVLVVLGASMLVDGTGPQATLGFDSYLRDTYASWAIQRHHYSYVVVSGPDGLAEALAKLLLNNGLKREQLLIENAARTTEQNAQFVKNILDHQPGLPPRPTIAILTSDYHCRRARLVFEHAGMPVRVIPVPDVGKRAGFVTARWNAFLDVAIEVVKLGFYRLNRKI